MIAPSRKRKLTPPQLAAAWGIDPQKVLHWIKSGELRAVNLATHRDGRPRYAIDVSDLAAFEASRAVQAPAPRVRRRKTDPSVIQFF
jgi:hypothetical protein